MNLQGEKHVFFMGKTQLVPAGYVVNKVGLGGGSVWVPNKIETPMLLFFFFLKLDLHMCWASEACIPHRELDRG